MWRRNLWTLYSSKWDYLPNTQLLNNFCKKKKLSISYSQWTRTRKTFLKKNLLLTNNSLSIEKLQEKNTVDIVSYNIHEYLSHKEFHVNATNFNRHTIQKSEGKFGESDPFSLNEDSLSKYTHSEPKKERKLEVTKLNLYLKGEVTEKDIEAVFPQPRSTLNNFEVYMNKKVFDIMFKHTPLKPKNKNKIKNAFWICKVQLYISDPIEFEGSSSTKNSASHTACLKALHWLFENKYMNRFGMPIHTKEEINEMKKNLNPPINLNLSPESHKCLKEMVEMYNEKIDTLIKSTDINNCDINDDTSKLRLLELKEGCTDSAMNFEYFNDIKNDVFYAPLDERDEKQIKTRNTILLHRLETRPDEKQLPISDFKYDILRTVESHNAIVISGAPGCGKSTRVPSYILDHLTERNEGGDCNILISQPRRVAAISLAHRVASERHEKMGDTCGYQVRLSSILPKSPGGVLLFCTAGTLLRRLSCMPNLPGCSHLIIDEAHERSIDSDAVMTLAKRAMSLNPRLKVIVMSATLDTQLFSNYLGNCPILEIPGFTYPVESHFLEDLPKNVSLHLHKTWNSSNMNELKPVVDPDEVTTVIKWLNDTKPEGAILVFLPGWREIVKVKDKLENSSRCNEYSVFPIHSRLSNEEQQKIFSHVPPGIRKIILATNIAETSITINDVSYVLDSGAFKEKTIIDDSGTSSLNNSWISEANVKQRKGRAGRVKSGECYHLYTKFKMNTFDENPTPEIFKISLEKTILDCKIYNQNEKALSFLRNFPQPPNIQLIEIAVNNLIELGALNPEENLTALGKRIVGFTIHPKLSKALVYSTIFKVTSPILIGATILSNNYDFFSCSIDNKRDLREIKKEYHPTSDHQSLYWINKNYQSIKVKEDYRVANSFCKERHIRQEKLDSLAAIREIYVEHLQKCKMLNVSNYKKGQNFGNYDAYSDNDELAKGVLLSGINSFLSLKTIVKTHGKLTKVNEFYTENKQRAFLSAESINYRIENILTDPILIYYGGIHFEERRGVMIRESSLLTPISLFLFCANVTPVSLDANLMLFEINNSKTKLYCSKELGDTLIRFRNMMWNFVDFYVRNEGLSKYSRESYGDQTHNSSDAVDQLWNDILKNISHILSEAEIKSLPTKK